VRNDYASVRFVGPPGWRRLPPVTRWLLPAAAAGYLATVFRAPFVAYLTADPERILRGELWRLLTYPLVNVSILNLLFALLLLWSIGFELEVSWGWRRYGLFLLSSTLLAGAVGVGLSRFWPGIGLGLTGLLTTVIVAWALLGPRLPTNLYGVLLITRSVFAIFALLIAFFGTWESSGSLAQVGFALGGLPVAWLFTRRRRQPFAGAATPLSRVFRRRRFHVVRRDDDRIN